MLSIMDVFGLLLLIAAASICLVVSFYIYAAFAHPSDGSFVHDDKAQAIVVAGTFLALFITLAPIFDIFFSFQASTH